MSIPSSLVGTVFNATQVSEGTVSGTGPITFTENELLADQSLGPFGTVGDNATATVQSVVSAAGVTSITFTLGGNFILTGQTITGTVIGNDANDILISGTLFGQAGDIYLTADPAQQPGVGNSVSVTAEASAGPYTACYCAGTRILTERGEKDVATLAEGDRVLTAGGASRPIRWIGRRSYLGRFLAANPGVRPIRFRAGSLGGGLPHRDLLVSPEHAMLVDGVLIPARHLLNGVTIVQEHGAARVDYFHVELDSHDALLAEGAASESFLDDGSRGMFQNAHEFQSRNPGGVSRGGFCAPRVDRGPQLDAVRSRLAAIAGQPARAA